MLSIRIVELTSCSPSEGPCHYYPGSFVYCHPSEVDQWNQSVSFGEASIPTPPDTVSECASLDFQDMSSQAWSQTSLPEDWTSLDHRTLYPTTSSDWQTSEAPVTYRCVQAIDEAAYLSATQGSVDLGLSPVLSHESQSSRTLNSLSEPDICTLPPSLDFSFAAEPSWDGNTGCSSPDVVVHSTADYGLAYSMDQSGLPMDCASTMPHGYYPGTQPVFFPQGGQAAYPRRDASYTPVAPMRPLLPRTESSAFPAQATHGPHRVLRPQVQGTRNSPVSSVSTASGRPPYGPQHAAVPGQLAGRHGATSRPRHSPVQSPASGVSNYYRAASKVQANVAVQNRSNSLSFVADPTADDFSAFIHMDQEDHASSSSGTLRSGNCSHVMHEYRTNV